MALINISNLTFSYDTNFENIFDDVSFQIDSDWKLGLIGRNGRGKTTLLKILTGELDYYKGNVSSSVKFDYFPYEVENKDWNSIDILLSLSDDIYEWQILKEMSSLDIDDYVLYRPFDTLSGGEQTKLLLVGLFLKSNNFLLIDEPTNHLDVEGRNVVSEYLNSKKGYILVSHDRTFIDKSVNYILSINKSDITLERGNLSSFMDNKQMQDDFELRKDNKLKREIAGMEKSAKRVGGWSAEIEASKFGEKVADRGFIGHKAAKMMKRSKNIERRKKESIEEKKSLLQNIEVYDDIDMLYVEHHSDNLANMKDLALYYDDTLIQEKISLNINKGDRIAITGGNGTGKTTLLKLINGAEIRHTGDFNIASNLKISYISQDTSFLKGSLDKYIYDLKLDETLFKTILIKLDFNKNQFDKDMNEYSQGQRKKVLIAKSLSEEANLFLWDEVLNYIDIYSRIQIENVILEYEPTLVFIEHDRMFADKIGTKNLRFNHID